MNPTLVRALVIAAPVSALLAGASVALNKARTAYALCWFVGAACLAVVVLTHVAEGMRWFPSMRWGQPTSAGHYLDLASALLGASLLVAGTVARMAHRSPGEKSPPPA